MFEKEIVLLAGRPGSGKSTLAKAAKEELALREITVEHLSIGDRLRAIGGGAVKSAYAAAIAEHSGQLSQSKRLPAEIVREVVREYVVTQQDTNLIFVDGYPRYLDEVAPFMQMIGDSEARVSALVHLALPNNIARDRILSRGTRDNERSVDASFADWRLMQHDQFYNETMTALKTFGVPVFEFDATENQEVLTGKVLTTLLEDSFTTR